MGWLFYVVVFFIKNRRERPLPWRSVVEVGGEVQSKVTT